MNLALQLVRLTPLAAGLFVAATSLAVAQPDPDKPVTPPDSYRVVMENDRVRMIEVHIKAHSKVNVDSPANRERFLYMLSDGALILAPPLQGSTFLRLLEASDPVPQAKEADSPVLETAAVAA